MTENMLKKRLTHHLLYISTALIFLNVLCHAEWVKTNKPEGRFLFLTTSMGDNLFSATSDSGVFFSSDSGKNWNTIGPANIRVNSIATIGSNLIIGTPDSGVFRTSDTGKTWSLTNKGLPYPSAGQLVVNDTVLFLVCNGVLFRSIDKGESWVPLNPGGRNARVNLIKTTEDYVFAGTENGEFYRSPDNGETWSGSGVSYVINLLTSGNIVIASTFKSGVMFSADFGSTWKEIGWRAVINQYGFNSLIVFGSNIFIGTSAGVGTNGGIVRSLDSGNSWSLANESITNPDVESFRLIGSEIFAVTADSSVWKRPASEFTTSINKHQISPGKIMHPQLSRNNFGRKKCIEFIYGNDFSAALGRFDANGKVISYTY